MVLLIYDIGLNSRVLLDFHNCKLGLDYVFCFFWVRDNFSIYHFCKYLRCLKPWLRLCVINRPSLASPGGRLGLKHARMCVSKSEGNGFFFGFKGMK